MPQIRARVVLAGEATAAFLDRTEVGFDGATLDVDGSLAREGGAVAGDAGWQHAVKHIDAARDQLDHLRRRSKSHRVTSLAGWQKWLRRFHRLHHFMLRLADAHAADGVSVEFHFNQGARTLFAQFRVRAALHNAKNRLAIGARLFATFGGPANCSFHGFVRYFRRGIMGRTFIEYHCDVRAEHALNFHRFFWTEKQRGTVQVGSELDAVGFDFPNFCKAENLEATAVGEDRQRPIHK